jgi:hypothetical protein
MKFWRPILLTTIIFFSICSVVLYSSCEKDPCKGVTCLNGGSCYNGVCSCQTGFEGPLCADKMTTRFVGAYAGYSTCNNGAPIIDTIWVTDNVYKNTTGLQIEQTTTGRLKLLGNVSQNSDQTYAIRIPDRRLPNYNKVYNLMWQRTTTGYNLTMNTFEYDSTVAGGIVHNKCVFVGSRK